MSKHKQAHTGGKWEWYWRKEDGEASCGVVSERGYSVCRSPRYQTREQWEADARLIAAAPELLEFVEDWLSRQGSDDNFMTQKARALFAKATGEQP